MAKKLTFPESVS